MSSNSIIARAGLYGSLPVLAVFSLAINVLLLVQPLYMLQIYDRVLASASFDTLIYISLIAVAALVLLGLMDAVRGLLSSRIAARLDERLGPQALLAAMHGPRAREGDVQPMRDLEAIRNFVSNKLLLALFDLPFAPFFIAILYLIHPDIFWLTLAGAAVLAVIALSNQFASARPATRASAASIEATGTAQSFVRGYESLKAMGMIENAISRWGASECRALDAQARAASVNAWFAGLSKTVRMGLQIAILGYGGYLVLEGEMTAGMIFAASLISGRALQPIDQVIGGWRGFVETSKARKRLLEALSTVTDERDKTELPAAQGRIGVTNLLVFAPNAGPGDEPLLKNVSFNVLPGECTVVLGPSGAGKSTLMRALVGTIRPHSGTVRIDGSEIEHWRAQALGERIGYLGQDVELFPGTVAQNIARFDPEADDRAVIEAAQMAGVHDLIRRLPQGYDTRIGPGGLALSGGQRQRVALARAFFRMPTILVLDEPNASLDTEGEAALDQAILAAKANKVSVVLVTQRRTIVERADKVLLLDNGQVEDFGAREAVIARRAERLKANRRRPDIASPAQPGPAQGPASGDPTIGPFATAVRA
ncbi:type I secretion system permease/ATPase [Fulvimarina sp. 2208YS6-2-32]|uniref:Type I secretion system permease/ATPase n=1 Tax=Fulvimarina uroteuthidis TaxID=3098149 RepID=A0ABU5I290_9HYPH|nr:type I secretion system permease/ATPase [Fulvimarina sp. 2208YS6-2-32]MDY8109257.1 type I secretion system permease/ATPase [Fulvimarina sp. 2208YS6-2-32]